MSAAGEEGSVVMLRGILLCLGLLSAVALAHPHEDAGKKDDLRQGEEETNYGKMSWQQQAERNNHHHIDDSKTPSHKESKNKKMAKPYPKEMEQKMAKPYHKEMEQKMAKPYTAEVEKKVEVERPYPIYIPQPYPVYIENNVPFEVKVPVPQPFTIKKEMPYEVNLPEPQPFTLQEQMPYEEKLNPVANQKKITPYTFKVPLDKTYPIEVAVGKDDNPYMAEKLIQLPMNLPVRPKQYYMRRPFAFQPENQHGYPAKLQLIPQVREEQEVEVPYPQQTQPAYLQQFDEGSEEVVSATVQVQDPKESQEAKPVSTSYTHSRMMGAEGKEISFSTNIDHYSD